MIEVGKIYQVKVNNKYWFRGEVIAIEDNKATVVVPTYYDSQYDGFIVTADLNELREVEVDLTKKDNKYRK